MKTRIVRNEFGYMPQQRVFFIWCDIWHRRAAFKTLDIAKDQLQAHIKSQESFEEVVWENK